MHYYHKHSHFNYSCNHTTNSTWYNHYKATLWILNPRMSYKVETRIAQHHSSLSIQHVKKKKVIFTTNAIISKQKAPTTHDEKRCSPTLPTLDSSIIKIRLIHKNNTTLTLIKLIYPKSFKYKYFKIKYCTEWLHQF